MAQNLGGLKSRITQNPVATKYHIPQNPILLKIPSAKNPVDSKSLIPQNPVGTKSRIPQNYSCIFEIEGIFCDGILRPQVLCAMGFSARKEFVRRDF